MTVVHGFEQVPAGFGPSAVTMGNFDGVHLGHREVLRRLDASARAEGLASAVLTFFPHPLKTLAPDRAPPLIQTLDDRIECLRQASPPDLLVVVPFTREFAAIEADAFVDDWLGARLRCARLLVGGDARFGRGRVGDVDLLRRRAGEGRFALSLLEAVEEDGLRVSSSLVRRRVASGDVRGAARLLGREFSIPGQVVRGAGRGRGIGFPTANLRPDGELRPADGIYATWADVDGRRWPAAVHLGPVPTFGQELPALEAHLVGFDGDLLDRPMRLGFVERLRGIVRFDGIEDLKRGIAADVARTLEILGAA